jgi:hypothetical protein
MTITHSQHCYLGLMLSGWYDLPAVVVVLVMTLAEMSGV